MHIVSDSPVAAKPARARKTAPAAPAADSALARAVAHLETALRSTLRDPDYTLPMVAVAARPAPAPVTAPVAPVAPVTAPVASRPAPAPVAAPALAYDSATAFGPVSRYFDISQHDGEIVATNPATGNTVRFRITSEKWTRAVRVVYFHDGSIFVPFAFADSFGIRPWGPNSKCPLPIDRRAAYARFLERLDSAVATGVELLITRT